MAPEWSRCRDGAECSQGGRTCGEGGHFGVLGCWEGQVRRGKGTPMGLEKGLGGHVACGGVFKATLPLTSCERITAIGLIPSPGAWSGRPFTGALGEQETALGDSGATRWGPGISAHWGPLRWLRQRDPNSSQIPALPGTKPHQGCLAWTWPSHRPREAGNFSEVRGSASCAAPFVLLPQGRLGARHCPPAGRCPASCWG